MGTFYVGLVVGSSKLFLRLYHVFKFRFFEIVECHGSEYCFVGLVIPQNTVMNSNNVMNSINKNLIFFIY